MSSKQKRFTPKRREMNPVRRMEKGSCVKCENYEVVDGSPCLWKLEAQIDKAIQHMNIALANNDLAQFKKASKCMNRALSLIRKITAKHRVNSRVISSF